VAGGRDYLWPAGSLSVLVFVLSITPPPLNFAGARA